MAYLNERWFGANDSYLEASGFSLGASIRARYDGSVPTSNGGIQHPLRTVLPAGATLMRFDGSSRPSVARNGKWWLTWAQYLLVQSFAKAQGLSEPAAVAELCYVPEEWNDMHVVIRVRLKQPLLAYTGVGAAALGNHRAYPVRGDATGRQIVQAYIPGLHDTNVHDALAVIGTGFVPGR